MQAVLGALRLVRFKACSEEVDAALKPDGMKSVVHLIPDMLRAGLPMLIYEGTFSDLPEDKPKQTASSPSNITAYKTL